MQCVREDVEEAVYQTIVEGIELAREGAEQKCKNAKLLNWDTEMENKLEEARAAKDTMRSQLEVGERHITALRVQLADAELAIRKLAGKASRTETDLRAQVTCGTMGPI